MELDTSGNSKTIHPHSHHHVTTSSNIQQSENINGPSVGGQGIVIDPSLEEYKKKAKEIQEYQTFYAAQNAQGNPVSVQVPVSQQSGFDISHSHQGKPTDDGSSLYAQRQDTFQYAQFGDNTMEVAAAAIGIDFSTSIPDNHAHHSHPHPHSLPPQAPQMVRNPATVHITNMGHEQNISTSNNVVNSEIQNTTEPQIKKRKLDQGDELVDLAQTVRQDQTEEHRQMFATAWLRRSCVASPSSVVPRNRIYARYLEICTKYNLKPLNPASFGKLVRVVFPDIKTRRLGVRGQSKYHYSGVKLVGELERERGTTNSPDSTTQFTYSRASSVPSTGNNLDFGTTSSSASATAPYSALVGNDLRFDFTDIINSRKPINSVSLTDQHVTQAFSIPHLQKSISGNIDPDFISTLNNSYLSHCRALIEALRFMHIKKFLNSISSFVGTLTAPVQKLLFYPEVIDWISSSDWRMYKEMVQMLSPLGLTEIPIQVLTGLKSLAQYLPVHLTNIFKDKLLEAKLKPAQAFSNLLDRLIRANETGLNAGKILSDSVETGKMKADWERFVDPKAIVLREVPCGSYEAQKILGEDVIQLLSMGSASNSTNGIITDSSKPDELVISKWAHYLSCLPYRFPNVQARLFLLCMSGLLTAALREISMNGGEGFGAWWVVRCWIDEWMGWNAEMGGFLAYDSGYPEETSTSHMTQPEGIQSRHDDGQSREPHNNPGSSNNDITVDSFQGLDDASLVFPKHEDDTSTDSLVSHAGNVTGTSNNSTMSNAQNERHQHTNTHDDEVLSQLLVEEPNKDVDLTSFK